MRPWSTRLLFHPLVLTCGAVLLSFSEVLLFDRGLHFRDHHLVYRPRWLAVIDSIMNGEIPALTHGAQGRLPIDHLLNGTYTPGALIFLLAPFEVAYDWFIVFHFVVLAIGAFLLAGRLGADRTGATISAAVLTLSGPVLSLENLVVALIGFAYVPWVLLTLHRLLSDASAENVALASLALGLHLQAIIPSVVVLDLVAGAFLLWHVRPKPSLRLCGALGSAALLGLSLASMALLPELEALPGTVRGQGFSDVVLSGWALSPGALLGFLAPSFWAPPDVPFLNPGPITGNITDPPYFTTLYLGTALPLVVLGALERRTAWATVSLLFFLILAMGKHTPLHGLVSSLPLLGSERYAVKYTLVVVGLAVYLAAMGARAMGDRPNRLRAVAALHVSMALCLVIAVSSDAWRTLSTVVLKSSALRWGVGDRLPAVVEIAHREAWLSAGHSLLAAVAFTAIAFWCTSKVDRTAYLAKLVPGILLLDLALAATTAISGVADDAVEFPPQAAVRLRSGPPYMQYWAEPVTQLPPLSVELPEGRRTHLEALMASRASWADLPTPLARRFLDFDLDGQSNRFHRTMSLVAMELAPPRREQLLQRLGVRYVISSRQDVNGTEIAEWMGALGSVRMVELSKSKDYVDGYHRWRPFDLTMPFRRDETGRTIWIDRVTDPESDDIANVLGSESSTVAPGCPPEPRIEFSSRGTNGPIEADVDASCRALVVLQEIATAGWRVTIDDRPADQWQVDGGYIGVFVERGRHRVVFEYTSLVRKWAPLSLAAFVLITFLLVFSRHRKSTKAFVSS